MVQRTNTSSHNRFDRARNASVPHGNREHSATEKHNKAKTGGRERKKGNA